MRVPSKAKGHEITRSQDFQAKSVSVFRKFFDVDVSVDVVFRKLFGRFKSKNFAKTLDEV